ncbi:MULTISPECIES: response regulator transcription factor [unclassified Campylobacter]|uniref:response regulator transcription factor n=1 Tax=unclassified Campylobacter TaxID=2593542 RepID=UPI001BD9DAA5|nr:MULTISPECIES: response regulator transcription factor [unclassified Campylobacter]MBZ7978127.1 response regulator transcription factor [Campylobacter sp. RM12654]MBZ7981428.1 response regulator transcription factor [Campylobacter sp. RM12640]MBZ7983939.1 response regulator transcription factor [Campylobacter sp. RM12647]MBZ7989214.1 response regulator transcription factor [Campylobacter sp. RM12635]MBZ7992422.1 response regulator transcription factor [Campylobacter sp. RM9333]
MLSLLIVEDEKNIAHLMGDILAPLFYEVHYAQDGLSGLNKFKKLRPDIVICDVLMPLKDGLSLAKSIKDLSPNTPIIVISAHSDKEKLLKAIDVNVNKYLIKPVIPEELIASVKSLVSNMSKVTKIGDYTIDYMKSTFKTLEFEVELTKKELTLLKALSEPIGKVVSLDEIKEICWGKSDVKDGSVRTFIKRFRDKLGVNIIKNITSTGYKIVL